MNLAERIKKQTKDLSGFNHLCVQLFLFDSISERQSSKIMFVWSVRAIIKRYSCSFSEVTGKNCLFHPIFVAAPVILLRFRKVTQNRQTTLDRTSWGRRGAGMMLEADRPTEMCLRLFEGIRIWRICSKSHVVQASRWRGDAPGLPSPVLQTSDNFPLNILQKTG